MELKKNLQNLITIVGNKWKHLYDEYICKLSSREIGLVACGVLILSYMLLDSSYSSISAAFDAQSKRIALTELSARRLATELKSYLDVSARRDRIEKQYKEIEMKEEPRSFVESLISNKLPDVPRPSISLKNPRDFGGSYKREGLSVNFRTANYEGLIGLLKEMVEGDNPLIVSKLKLDRSGTYLRVDMEVDSIRRK